MSPFCQHNPSKIHGNYGIRRTQIQNIVQKEYNKYNIALTIEWE
jgi:hypothetical protein